MKVLMWLEEHAVYDNLLLALAYARQIFDKYPYHVRGQHGTHHDGPHHVGKHPHLYGHDPRSVMQQLTLNRHQ